MPRPAAKPPTRSKPRKQPRPQPRLKPRTQSRPRPPANPQPPPKASHPRAPRTARAPQAASHPDDTRDRLLRAARDVFGEVGFRRATVRDIVARAGANVAAVNYHFGDKDRLYAEVVLAGVALGLQLYPVDMGVPPVDPTPEQRLLGFVRSFLYRTLAQGEHACSGRIMLWEMVEPTPVLDALYQERIKLLYARLESIVHDLLGPAATPERVRLGCASVLGQCTFYRLGESLLSKVQGGPTTNLPPEKIETLAAHVTSLTAAGLRAYANQNGAPPPAPFTKNEDINPPAVHLHHKDGNER